MSGSRFPVGRCMLLVNHHGIPEPSELVLGACFPLKSPFRSMLLTLRGGPESFAPRAHRIPIYPIVFQQIPRSPRRNELPVKLVDGTLLMRHEHPTCALV